MLRVISRTPNHTFLESLLKIEPENVTGSQFPTGQTQQKKDVGGDTNWAWTGTLGIPGLGQENKGFLVMLVILAVVIFAAVRR